MIQRALFSAVLVLLTAPVGADQILLKDGKIIEGKVLDSTKTDVLIREKLSGKPMLFPASEVLSQKIDPPPPKVVPPPDPKRYVQTHVALIGGPGSAKELNPKVPLGMRFGGGFRAHPSFEVEGGVDYRPGYAGDLTIEAGSSVRRRYQRFYSYAYNFGIKGYPFRRLWGSEFEPYVHAGYGWSWIVPKGSGDKLSGSGWRAGMGSLYRVKGLWYLDSRLSYEYTGYKDVNFLGQSGTFVETVKSHHVTAHIGILRKW